MTFSHSRVINQINTYGDWCLKKFGTRLFFPADEFYIKAELPLPSDEFYEDYSQIENGVGMLTDLQTCIDFELEDVTPYEDFSAQRTVSIATGYAAYAHICEIADKLMKKFDGLNIRVYKIKNNFFGETITVAGLLTAKDISEQLKGEDLGDALLVPQTALRADGEVFLDDVSPSELSEMLGTAVIPTRGEACEFIEKVLGL